MTALEDARAAERGLTLAIDSTVRMGGCPTREMYAARDALRALIAEHERLNAEGSCWDIGPEMIAPKGECAPMPPLCELKAGHLGAHKGGQAEWIRRERTVTVEYHDEIVNFAQRRIHELEGQVERLTAPPTDDERALFEALADRLEQHPQARNYEIADSGEGETKLVGPLDVEALAEWLMPVFAGFRRQGPPTDAQVREALVRDLHADLAYYNPEEAAG